MDRKELVTLKLQMGISPAVQVAPDVLRAMWQQLERERAKTPDMRLDKATSRSRDH